MSMNTKTNFKNCGLCAHWKTLQHKNKASKLRACQKTTEGKENKKKNE